MSKKETMAEKKGQFHRSGAVLVEFKAPAELVKAFDSKVRPRFSNRSEAIRHLMREFLETSEGAYM